MKNKIISVLIFLTIIPIFLFPGEASLKRTVFGPSVQDSFCESTYPNLDIEYIANNQITDLCIIKINGLAYAYFQPKSPNKLFITSIDDSFEFQINQNNSSLLNLDNAVQQTFVQLELENNLKIQHIYSVIFNMGKVQVLFKGVYGSPDNRKYSYTVLNNSINKNKLENTNFLYALIFGEIKPLTEESSISFAKSYLLDIIRLFEDLYIFPIYNMPTSVEISKTGSIQELIVLQQKILLTAYKESVLGINGIPKTPVSWNLKTKIIKTEDLRSYPEDRSFNEKITNFIKMTGNLRPVQASSFRPYLDVFNTKLDIFKSYKESIESRAKEYVEYTKSTDDSNFTKYESWIKSNPYEFSFIESYFINFWWTGTLIPNGYQLQLSLTTPPDPPDPSYENSIYLPNLYYIDWEKFKDTKTTIKDNIYRSQIGECMKIQIKVAENSDLNPITLYYIKYFQKELIQDLMKIVERKKQNNNLLQKEQLSYIMFLWYLLDEDTYKSNIRFTITFC